MLCNAASEINNTHLIINVQLLIQPMANNNYSTCNLSLFYRRTNLNVVKSSPPPMHRNFKREGTGIGSFII